MPFLHLLFQVPLAQNNSYSQVTYFEVAYSAALHYIILEFIVLAKGMMSGFRNLPLLLCIIPGSLALVLWQSSILRRSTLPFSLPQMLFESSAHFNLPLQHFENYSIILNIWDRREWMRHLVNLSCTFSAVLAGCMLNPHPPCVIPQRQNSTFSQGIQPKATLGHYPNGDSSFPNLKMNKRMWYRSGME